MVHRESVPQVKTQNITTVFFLISALWAYAIAESDRGLWELSNGCFRSVSGQFSIEIWYFLWKPLAFCTKWPYLA